MAEDHPKRRIVNGQEWFCSDHSDGRDWVAHHRLLYVARHGWDALEPDDQLTHEGIPWDNRPENIKKEGRDPPSLVTEQNGTERFYCQRKDRNDSVFHHRLLWVAHHGMDSLDADENLEHENGIRWDNRIENIQKQSDPPQLEMKDGYEYFRDQSGDGEKGFVHHRLLYVAEHGLDSLSANEHVHHRDHIPWHNVIENLEAVEVDPHGLHHTLQRHSNEPIRPTAISD